MFDLYTRRKYKKLMRAAEDSQNEEELWELVWGPNGLSASCGITASVDIWFDEAEKIRILKTNVLKP